MKKNSRIKVKQPYTKSPMPMLRKPSPKKVKHI